MIELLEHNKGTYNRLCEILKENNKCALVQATGTGKSYIAGKYIEEHTKKVLILVPTNAIADAWSDLLNGIEQEVDIITYQAFAKEPNNYLEYDLVVADEMHHLGSDVWGKKFVETYLQSENHKIIGLTATEIRYLDNSRDMAEEIFGNIRVDGCDLPTAINTGVLPTFKYVSALYCDESDFDEWKEKAGKIKDIKTQNELKGRLDVCIKNMVSVKQAVNENLTDDYKKIIVFLNNVGSKETALEMFKDVFSTANFYDVDYGKSRKENNSQIEKFKSVSKRSVLFAVDMLNEGIHVRGTDCIIMFRKTVSPQVYLQQLGRGLASGTDKMPIIFDFASNAKSISLKFDSQQAEEGVESIVKKWNTDIQNEKKIIFKSYNSEILDVFQKIFNITKIKKWTEEDDEYLKENYKKFSGKELGEYFGVTSGCVHWRARRLNLTEDKKWSTEEDDFLKKNIKNMTYKEISENLKRSKYAVKARAREIGSPKYSGMFSKEEDEYIKSNYGKLSANEIANTLGRTIPSIYWRARLLGVSRNCYVYTKEDDEFIMENYLKLTKEEIGFRIGRSASSVAERKRILGLTKKYRKKKKT